MKRLRINPSAVYVEIINHCCLFEGDIMFKECFVVSCSEKPVIAFLNNKDAENHVERLIKNDVNNIIGSIKITPIELYIFDGRAVISTIPVF